MRLQILSLTSLLAICCAPSCFPQPTPLVGGVSVMQGQGANFIAPVPIISGTRLRLWTDTGGGLPLGVAMTPTFLEPGSHQVTLHFEAVTNAPLVANRPTDIYVGNSLSALFKVNVSVVSPTAPSCVLPSLDPIDQSTQAVLVEGVTPGCDVQVWAGDASGLEPIATSSVTAGSTRVRPRLRYRLSPGQNVRVLQASGMTTTLLSAPFIVESNYVTSRYDNERSGWNPHENVLTVNTVRHLRKICEHPVDGAAIRAQPLYVQNVNIDNKGKHNVVFVATDSGAVWAFDADSCLVNDRGLWVDGAGNPSPRILFDASSGERAVTPSDLVNTWPPGSDPNCAIMLGSAATPVVDRSSNTIYVVVLLFKNNKILYRLHALDVRNGKDQPGSPVEISDATVQFKGVSFNPALQGDRAGLLLERGVLYIGFGSHCDIGGYHGWVLAYDANIPDSPGFLQQLGVFNTSPTSGGSGVWQSGLGLAANGDGTVYLLTGNGPFDPNAGNYGNTLLNLRLPTNPASKELEVVTSFTPWDWSCAYNPGDRDLGSGGPVMLSPQDVAPPSALSIPIGPQNLIIASGKLAKSYLIDRNCVNCSGDPNRCPATPISGCPQARCTTDDSNLVIQRLDQPMINRSGIANPGTGGMVAGPAYYTGPAGTRVFVAPNYLSIRAYNFQGFPPTITSAEETPDEAPATSPIPTVSSNGSVPGTGVLWAVFHPASPEPLRLHAYEANNIANNLFSGLAHNALDVGTAIWPAGGPHSGNSFQVPTVIHGKVYAGSADRLVIFAPVYRCFHAVDCNHAVAFMCHKIPPELILQRKTATAWLTVPGPSSIENETYTYLFDYPSSESATYRVCFKDQPKSCMPQVTIKMNKAHCQVPKSLHSQCGVPGKPPCFMKKSWPVSPGRKEDGDDNDRPKGR